MKTSQRGIDLIKGFEGCRLVAYKPVPTEKYWTIGYGHYGPDVVPGMKITPGQAEIYLKADLAKFEKDVDNTGLSLNQNQFDALVSFTYNCGAGNLKTLIKGRTLPEISEALLKYTKDNSKRVLPGLVRRRNAERALFLTGAPAAADPNRNPYTEPTKAVRLNSKGNDVRWLQERGVKIWDEWEIQEDGKWYATQNILEEDGNEIKLVKKDIIKANVNISCPNNFSLVNNICISNYNLEKNKNITCNINDIPQLDTRRIIRERIIGVTEQNGNCYLQYCNDTYTDVVGTLWQPGMQCYDIEYIQNNPIISYTCNGYTDSNGNCKETRNRIISYECEEGTLDGDNCIIITKKEVQLQCRENYQYNSNCKLCEKVK